MKCLLTALVNRMEKETNQVQFCQELPVLNPRKHCDLFLDFLDRLPIAEAAYHSGMAGICGDNI